MPRRPREAIPVTIVTGRRGAGKTTLINRLLADRQFADTAVILNDFGEIPLRGGNAVQRAEDGFLELGSGCVCCSVRGALPDALEQLLRDLDNGRLRAIARVVIEADSEADPTAVLAAVERHPYLSLRYAADGIVTVLDASSAEALLRTDAVAVRQVATADVIALAPSVPDGLPESLASINPVALVANAVTLPLDLLVGHGGFDPAIDDLDAWLSLAPAAGAPASGEAGRICCFTVERNRPMSFARLDLFVEYLAMLQAPNLLRVRGAVASGEGDMIVVDGVGGHFRPPAIVDRSVMPALRFAVIARDLDRAMFEDYLDAFLGEPRVDEPDAAALADNPLAIGGFSARSGR